jgi:hypothetical protein
MRHTPVKSTEVWQMVSKASMRALAATSDRFVSPSLPGLSGQSTAPRTGMDHPDKPGDDERADW